MQLARKLKLKVSHKGIGVVFKQTPEQGAELETGVPVTLHYQPPRL